MMRVLHAYAGNLYGGVEAMLATFARERDACPRMQPEFALAYEGRLSAELERAGAAVRVTGGARLSRPWTVWAARRRFANHLSKSKPDVVVCHSAWAHAVFAPAARRARIPLVFWLHDAVSGGWAERAAARTRPDLAVCTSRFTADTLPALFPGVRAEVIHPAVAAPPPGAPADRAAVQAELGTADDAVVIVQISRMEPWKGHRVHLEALGEMRDDVRWTAWLVGGARREHEVRHLTEMRALAERLGIGGRVVFAGERSDVPRLLAAADVHCQPNLGPEPFGITWVEAMYAGLPVVASALGGALETVDDSVGLRVPAGNAHALADALRTLVGDAGLRARLGAAGPARARELCDPARQLDRLHGVLADLVDREAT